MTPVSKTVLERFEIRKSKRQKEDFRRWLCQTLEEAGYAPNVEHSRSLYVCDNVVVGDPDRAKLLLTAHYDTCAVLPFPNFITPRNLFWYLLYQLLIVVVMFLLMGIVGFGGYALLERVMPDADGAAMLSFLLTYAVLLFFLWWMLDGKANRHTANDNTSGVVTLLEVAQALPAELRGKVCFVFFDNEERGLLGSGAFAKRHKSARKDALVLNFDCVSDGDSIQFFPDRRVKKSEIPELLAQAYLPRGEKDVQVVCTFGFYPSDQASFRHGVGVCALKHSRVLGYYMDRIHTGRDTVMEEANIDLLRVGTVRFIRLLQEREQYAE